jgi:hypothetical protein
MEKLIFSKISLADLKPLVNLQHKGIATYQWTQVDSFPLTDHELRQLQDIKSHLFNCDTQLMNEITIWARAIYPLLLLAEQGDIQAWGGVTLQARYAKFELEGIADGVLAKCEAGWVTIPYLVVVETKKGVEGQNPVFQLYGQLLVAAHLNWENDPRPQQEVFGCYTIADTWKFVRAEIEGIDTDIPTMRLEYSREYTEKYDAETILKILKSIVAKHVGS